MFCHECGNAIIENAAFCGKCGTKIIIDSNTQILDSQSELSVQEPSEIAQEETTNSYIPMISDESVTPEQIQGASGIESAEEINDDRTIKESSKINNTDIDKILSRITLFCSKISEVSLTPKGVLLKGLVFKYTINVKNGQIAIKEALTLPLTILFTLILIPAGIASNYLADAYRYFDVGYEDFRLWSALTLVAAGVFCLIVYYFLGRKEKNDVISNINILLKSGNTDLSISPEKKSTKLFSLIISLSCIIIGIFILLFSFWDDSVSNVPQANTEWHITIPTTIATDTTIKTVNLAKSVNISLDQTYTNDEEGFSFNFPSGWETATFTELDKDEIILAYAPLSLSDIYYTTYTNNNNMFEFSAGILIRKEYMSETIDISDIVADININELKKFVQEEFSENFTIDEISYGEIDGITAIIFNGINDEDISVKGYCYFYRENAYYVSLMTLNKTENLNRFEPVFESIMESYTIKPIVSSTQTDSEKISLSQIYTNDEERFSFKYPDGWTVDNYSDFIISIDDSLNFININVVKEIADDTLFNLTKMDFQELYSSLYNDVVILDLSNISLDGVPARKVTFSAEAEGVYITCIQCIYIIDDYMYYLSCVSVRGIFDKNKPIFDAIINSYTIKNTSVEKIQPATSEAVARTTATVAPESQLTIYEAEALLQEWLDNHEFNYDTHIDDVNYTEDGFLIRLNQYNYHIFEFGYVHVDKLSGKLYWVDTDKGYIPLDDWYNDIYKKIQSEYPGEVIYGKYLVSWLINLNTSKVLESLGEPLLEGNAGAGHYFKYDNDTYIYFDESVGNVIEIMTLKPSAFYYNGVSLDKDRNGLIALLGTPSNEGEQEPSDIYYGYEMIYHLADCKVYFYMSNPNKIVESIFISLNNGANQENANNEQMYLVGAYIVDVPYSSDWFVGGELIHLYGDGTGSEDFEGGIYYFTWNIEEAYDAKKYLVLNYNNFIDKYQMTSDFGYFTTYLYDKNMNPIIFEPYP